MITGSHRRRVAVLFVDICGFTRLVDTTDPEVVYEVVRPLLDRLVVVVGRHDGKIQQVLGDGFMAVFGLPAVHGDEAHRAVRAGLALLGAAGPGHPAVHVGVESGEVLVTPSFGPAGFGVWGRAVNVAQRLCDLAGPGEMQIGPAAYAAAGAGIDRATPARAWLKGITHTVVAHRMMLPRTGAA